MLVKQAGCVGFVFPREFSSLFRVSRGQLGLLRLLSCGDLLLSLRDVIGEALLSSEVIEFVILWCYGFGTVLDFFGWFRCESPADRLPGQPCARRFKLSEFRHRPQAADPIRASVRGGAPPARLVFARHFHVTKNNLFLPLY